jgi:predicted AAA+ superfamily ATPase
VNLSNKETLEREFSKFDEIDDNYDKLIISNDKEELSKNGIKHLNIIDFLLREDI